MSSLIFIDQTIPQIPIKPIIRIKDLWFSDGKKKWCWIGEWPTLGKIYLGVVESTPIRMALSNFYRRIFS